jgi:hypothetical protein
MRRRAATRDRLMSEGVTEATAAAWIAAWEAQAAARSSLVIAPRLRPPFSDTWSLDASGDLDRHWIAE